MKNAFRKMFVTICGRFFLNGGLHSGLGLRQLNEGKFKNAPYFIRKLTNASEFVTLSEIPISTYTLYVVSEYLPLNPFILRF